MVQQAREQLRLEGVADTQERVADRLGCRVETVKRRSRENGGWRRA
jgi:hypothetical protein